MKKSLFILTILLSVMFLIFGCAVHTKLADYQPKSAEEKEVVKFFIECDEAYQDGNFPKFLECFRDDAKIRIFKERAGRAHPIVSKPQYENFLEEGGASKMTRSEILNPKITITGDSSTMKFIHLPEGGIHEVDFTIHETYDLVKENEKWKIIWSDWTWTTR